MPGPANNIAVQIGEIDAVLAGFDGKALQLIAAQPFPPGQPLELRVLPQTSAALQVAARCIGSQRREDGRFDVRLRPVNLDRATRLALERALRQP
jgi:hypothetical protein